MQEDEFRVGVRFDDGLHMCRRRQCERDALVPQSGVELHRFVVFRSNNQRDADDMVVECFVCYPEVALFLEHRQEDWDGSKDICIGSGGRNIETSPIARDGLESNDVGQGSIRLHAASKCIIESVELELFTPFKYLCQENLIRRTNLSAMLHLSRRKITSASLSRRTIRKALQPNRVCQV